MHLSYNRYMKKFIKVLAIFLLAMGLFIGLRQLLSEGSEIFNQTLNNQITETTTDKIDENGTYTSKEEVALYIHTFNKLPSNYISKKDAKELGWEANKGNLLKVCDGCSIGGDKFTNREKKLPTKKGRVYYECDIDYKGGNRNAKRIVYSNDGLIYYTDDHYNSFELLYGEP